MLEGRSTPQLKGHCTVVGSRFVDAALPCSPAAQSSRWNSERTRVTGFSDSCMGEALGADSGQIGQCASMGCTVQHAEVRRELRGQMVRERESCRKR